MSSTAEKVATSDSIRHDATQHSTQHEAHPKLIGLGAEGWVAVGTLLFLALAFYFKAHKQVASALDARIQKVKDQLAEAASLRAEAEKLKAEALAKQQEAEKTAADIVAHAKSEASQIITDAAANAEAMIARRTKMAEDKIAAAERAAEADVRAAAVSLATAAAQKLLQDRLDASGQAKLVDQAIAELDRRVH